ncbi:MAG: RsmB/NOP family class I SAM-dependent RNA methyltransferase [Beutenbergiaceae bacterium]
MPDHSARRHPPHARQRRGRGGPAYSTSTPRQRARSADPARRAAFDALCAVAQSDAYANLVLPGMLSQRGIGGRDAAFATELTYGTIRLQGRYDRIIELASNRAIADLDRPVLDVLRLGAHQLLGMRVPDHAAVSQTVGLARAACGSGPAQLVNAVLRRISEADLSTWLERIEAGPDPLPATSSHPAWVIRALRQSLAHTRAGSGDLPQLLAAHNSAPAVTLALRPGLADQQDLPPEVTHARYADTAYYLPAGDPGSIAAVRQARVGVQDEGSQLVAWALAQAPLTGSDSRWLDLCAGPGGKAALLASVLAERDSAGVFVANEVSPHRARLVEQALAPLTQRLDVQVRVADGREVGKVDTGQYDRVLVDVPCTGLGALRRRPESRWRRQPGDIGALGPLQRDLLSSAIEATRPGGVIGYVTCSPHLAETALVVDDVSKRHDVELIDAVQLVQTVSREPVPGLEGPYVQLWPHRHHTDGMFLALLRRGRG